MKRLQAELTLERSKNNDGIFSTAEFADFSYIWESINTEVESEIEEVIYKEKERVSGGVSRLLPRKERKLINRFKCKINIRQLFLILDLVDHITYSHTSTRHYINSRRTFFESLLHLKQVEESELEMRTVPQLNRKLMTFGLAVAHDDERVIFTPKLHRFNYWLQYNNKNKDAAQLLTEIR